MATPVTIRIPKSQSKHLTKLRKATHKDTKSAIKKTLDGLGIPHWPYSQFGYGNVKGVADLFGIMPARIRPDKAGVHIAIEVKALDDKPTKHQLKHLKTVREAGGFGIVAYSVDDVIEGLGIQHLFLFPGRK